jgi:putative ABC transport system substrate-binding protein
MRRRGFIDLISGAAITWPAGARAQQSMPVIGYLSTGSLESDNLPGRLIAFRRSLNEVGYVEGQNVAIECRGAEGKYDRLPSLAADVVQHRVAVMVTPGTASAVAARAATATIPIVFNVAIDRSKRPCCQPQPPGRQYHRCIAYGGRGRGKAARLGA